MDKRTIIAGTAIVLVSVAIAAIYLLTHQNRHIIDDVNQITDGSGNAAVGANGSSAIVTYTDAGFSPSSIKVSKGTTITWTNASSQKLWVESTHAATTDCSSNTPDTTTLNECVDIENGGTYSHTFTQTGTFNYHNHEKTTLTGSVTVSDGPPAAGAINPNAIPE